MHPRGPSRTLRLVKTMTDNELRDAVRSAVYAAYSAQAFGFADTDAERRVDELYQLAFDSARMTVYQQGHALAADSFR